MCSLIAFSANVIQYGIDQLRDAPTDNSVLYIHWYVWTTFFGMFNVRFNFTVQAILSNLDNMGGIATYATFVIVAVSFLLLRNS